MLEAFTQYGYVGVFCAIVATGFGLPLPEELPILTGGIMVGHADTLHDGATVLPADRLRWWIMLPTCIIAVVCGDGVLYALGRIWGSRLLDRPWVQKKILSPEKRAQIEKNIHDRGILILLTARLTPGIRTPIFLMAGILRVPLTRFLIADGLYAIPGVNVIFWLAYFLTDQILEVFHKVEKYRPLIIVAVLSAVVGVLVYRYITNRRVNTGNPTEVSRIARPVEIVTEKATHAVEKTVDVAVHAMEKTIGAVTHLGHGEKPAPEGEPKPGNKPVDK